jgi:hypothetical protein
MFATTICEGSLFGRTFVALSEDNQRMGETHPNSVHSDELVEAIRDAYDAGAPPEGEKRTRYNSVGYKRLSRQFNVPVATVAKICSFERRAIWPARWKRI